jgi:integrase
MASLTVLGVRNAKPGRYADGNGLYLLVKSGGAKSWLLRVQHDGKRRDIGLGSVDVDHRRSADDPVNGVPILQRRLLNLGEAREKAEALRRFAKAGRDPVAERDKDRRPVPTFKEAAKACHKDLAGGWASKNAAAFLKSLEDHAFSRIGDLKVDQVEASHLRDMLAPIWLEIPEMARKVRQRAGIVLNFAKSKGWRTSEPPGKTVTMGLARHSASKNFAAMPYEEVPAFVADLGAKAATVGRFALLFAIHTAARSGEVRHAQWSHIDMERKLWNRPASIMKGKVAHSVTLTDDAIAVLKRAAKLRETTKPDAPVFPSSKGTVLSDMTLSKIMRDAKLPFTVHGFRSAFRDFAAEQMPTIPDAVAEAALAHVVPDKVERAYKRTQFLEMRRKLLDGWAAHLAGRGNVVQLTAAS